MSTVIKVESLGKKYLLNHNRSQLGYQTFRERLSSAFKREKKSSKKEEFWALKNLNFEIKQGDRVGIIGRNGAGKSTLLKVLSRVVEPSRGRISIKGRVASLLEVGTGFHPELTGRENVFLNGAILGMTREEIKKKFDAIISFAEVEKFLDTPVKRYSSGMYVRLAFSVAAHLEPEILIVDEVLAVGDAHFQKKCLGKMEAVGKEGRTVLFVSHHMGSIERLCNSGLILNQGEISHFGYGVDKLQSIYSKLAGGSGPIHDYSKFESSYFSFSKIKIVAENVDAEVFRNDVDAYLIIEGRIDLPDPGLQIGYSLYDDYGKLIYWSYHTDSEEESWVRLDQGKVTLRSKLPKNILNEGKYRIEVGVALYCKQWIFEPGVNSPCINFEISGGLSKSIYWTFKRPGILAPINTWERLD